MFLEVFADVWKHISEPLRLGFLWSLLIGSIMLVGLCVFWLTGLHIEFGMLYHISPLAHKLLNLFVVGAISIIAMIAVFVFGLWANYRVRNYYEEIKERAQNKLDSVTTTPNGPEHNL